jgi:predicted metalloprotease with PDZ domain
MTWNVVRPAALLLCAAWLACSAAAAAERSGTEDDVWLGVLIDDQSLDGGVQLIAIVPGGPAAIGGLHRGDVLLEADGRGLDRTEDLERVLSLLDPGDRIRLKVLRAGRALDRSIELGPRPTSTWGLVPPRPPEPLLPRPPKLPAVPEAPTLAAEYGFTVADVTPDLRAYYGAPEEVGVLVTEVRPGRAAHRAGLRVGDVLVELGTVGVRQAADVDDLLLVGSGSDEVVEARVVRNSRWTVARLDVPTVSPRVTAISPVSVDAGDFEMLERSIEHEIERLKRRLRELEGKLEQLREVSEGAAEQ